MSGRIHPDVCLVVGDRLFVGVSQKFRSACQRAAVPEDMLIVVLTLSANLARIIITVAYPTVGVSADFVRRHDFVREDVLGAERLCGSRTRLFRGIDISGVGSYREKNFTHPGWPADTGLNSRSSGLRDKQRGTLRVKEHTEICIINPCLVVSPALHRLTYSRQKLIRIHFVAEPDLFYIVWTHNGVVDLRGDIAVFGVDKDSGHAHTVLMKKVGVSRHTGIELRFVEVCDYYQTNWVGVRARSIGFCGRIGLQGGSVGVFVQLVVGFLPLCVCSFRAGATVTYLHCELGVDEIRDAVKNLDVHSVDSRFDSRAVDVIILPRENIVRGVISVRVHHKFETHLIVESVTEKHISVVVRVEIANPIEVKHGYLPARSKVAVFGFCGSELKLPGIKERLPRLRNRQREINGFNHRFILCRNFLRHPNHSRRKNSNTKQFFTNIHYFKSRPKRY